MSRNTTRMGSATASLTNSTPTRKHLFGPYRTVLPDRKAAAQAAIRYVQLVYGSQLQRPADEEAFDVPLDVASMTIEERNRLKRRLLAQHPELVEEYRALASDDP